MLSWHGIQKSEDIDRIFTGILKVTHLWKITLYMVYLYCSLLMHNEYETVYNCFMYTLPKMYYIERTLAQVLS